MARSSRTSANATAALSLTRLAPDFRMIRSIAATGNSTIYPPPRLFQATYGANFPFIWAVFKSFLKWALKLVVLVKIEFLIAPHELKIFARTLTLIMIESKLRGVFSYTLHINKFK